VHYEIQIGISFKTGSCGDGCCSWSEHFVELIDDTGGMCCVCDEYGDEDRSLPYMTRVEELYEWVKENGDEQMYTGRVTGMKRLDELDLELIIGEDRTEYNDEDDIS